MKWLTFAGILLYLSRQNDAAVLKCTPGSQESSCEPERDILTVQDQIEREKDTVSADTECLAGSEWESNCHYCRCSESGIAECLKQESCDLQIFEEPIKCKPFTSFRRDCNTCTCLMNGLGLCTLRECLYIHRRKRQMECEPGSSWHSSCNTCRCLQNGRAVCTKRGCLNYPNAVQKVCSPGTKWKDDCNTCLCTAAGQPECTEMKCDSIDSSNVEKRDTIKLVSQTPKHSIVKRGVCKPNQEFQLDCNPCKCAANGLSYTCTHNECLEGDNMNKEVEVFMESEENITTSSNYTKRVVCVANRMFIKDCNTCWCNEDGTSFFCTRKVCIPNSPDEISTEDPEPEVLHKENDKKCKPNEVFSMDCNMCQCNADGTSFSCTRRGCVEKNGTLFRQTRAVQADPPKTCQPGTEFRMDCNKCLCNDEGQDFSCTRIDCAALNNNGGVDSFVSTRSKREVSSRVKTQCTAGSVFNQSCNVCRCTEDGAHAVCTLMRCKDETVSAEPDTEPSFRCTPGDQFKRVCNDCTCSADGKTVFCTIRLCDEQAGI